MSIQDGIKFIRQVRDSEELRDQVLALDASSTAEHEALDGLVRIGAEAGLHFTAEELRQAHSHDWAMRWAHFHRGQPTRAETEA
ncbi:MAG: Nif11-like leader peptide family natural product precursor [Vicinamibacterales bacterium]